MASTTGSDAPGAGWEPAARAQLERELARLRDQRAELAPAPDDDRAGDNADQAVALERDDDLSFLDSRITEIGELLARGPQAAGTSDEPGGLPDGTEVTVRYADDTVDTLRVVASVQEIRDDDAIGVLTSDSPLGRALVGCRVGGVVTYDTPDGGTRVRLLDLVPAPVDRPR